MFARINEEVFYNKKAKERKRRKKENEETLGHLDTTNNS